MSMLNKDAYKMIVKFFKGDESFALLCDETFSQAFGDGITYSLSIGKSIRVGKTDTDLDFIIDAVEHGYYINIRNLHQIFEFHQDNGINLYRNNSLSFEGWGSYYYTPDYVIKYEDGYREKYFVLDAKYGDRVFIRKLQVAKLAFKYIFSISTRNNKAVDGLYVLYGDSKKVCNKWKGRVITWIDKHYWIDYIRCILQLF